MSHTCHAPGCGLQVPTRMFMCRRHWYALPQKIRNAIWREYREGQETDKNPSLRYLAVQQLACAHSVFKPYDEEATKEALKYLARAVGFAREAVREGLGDPLFGLAQKLDEL